MRKMTLILMAQGALFGLSAVEAAFAQMNEPISKGVMRKVGPATKALNPQPLPPNEKVSDATIITKEGRSITLGEIRAQQRLFKPPAAVVAKPFTLGAKTVRTPVLMHAPSQDNGMRVGNGIVTSVFKPGNAAAVSLYNCDEKPPVIGRVIGAVTPGSVITLKGACFGAASGEVRLLGDFAGGFRTLVPIKWEAGQIAVEIPENISGLPDGQVAIEARTPDRKYSKTLPVSFTAKRESVDVSNLWRSACQTAMTSKGRETIDLRCGNRWVIYHRAEFTGAYSGGGTFEVGGRAVPATPSHSNFTIEVNRHCYLEGAWADVRDGAVTDLSGWSDGPPNKSTINIVYQTRKALEEHWYGDTAHSFLDYTLNAKANCPVGVSPNP